MARQLTKFARKHYLQVTDQHFASATESKVAQQIGELGRQSVPTKFGNTENVGIDGAHEDKQYPVQDSNLEPSD